MTPKPRIIGPEDEDRRTDNPVVSNGEVGGPPPKRNRDAQRRAREAGVESLPDGEDAAEREAAKARDD
ncbi:MAG TPA: hypothetical protein VHE77_02185 [Dongiaceae bacterium]|jgi:hypothetical protein|nr:hypothetical protein [Dongiaceae bacterium]